MQPTIADEIRVWARSQLFNASVVTANTDVYNHVSQAVESLLKLNWTGQIITAIPASTARVPAE